VENYLMLLRLWLSGNSWSLHGHSPVYMFCCARVLDIVGVM